MLALTPVSVAQRLLEVGQLVEIKWSGQAPFAAIGVLAPLDRRSPALERFVEALKRSAVSNYVACA